MSTAEDGQDWTAAGLDDDPDSVATIGMLMAASRPVLIADPDQQVY